MQIENFINPPKNEKVLPRKTRIFLFFIIASVEWCMNLSAGIISSASKDIKTSFIINDISFGGLGYSNGIGRLIGCILFTILVNKINRKLIFLFCLICKSISLISFSFTHYWTLFVFIRGCIGFFHSPLSIYIPVWIDQYGLKQYKPLFLTILLAGIQLGKVLGYLLHYIFGEIYWQYGFIIPGVYLFIVGVYIAFTPKKYFSNKIFAIKVKESESELKDKNDNINNRDTIFEEIDIVNKENKKYIYSDFSLVLNNPLFILMMVTRALLLGTLTAFHYWIGDYMITSLNIQNGSFRLEAYFIITTGGPLIGVILSSLVRIKISSYEQQNAECALFALHLITSFFAISISFMRSIYTLCPISMVYLGFHAVTMPFIQGAITISVLPKLKVTAYSVANLFHLLFTSGPSPMIYGIIKLKYGKLYPQIGMLSIMLIYTSGTFEILLYIYLKKRSRRK